MEFLKLFSVRSRYFCKVEDRMNFNEIIARRGCSYVPEPTIRSGSEISAPEKPLMCVAQQMIYSFLLG